jgi:hypothetical protein
MDRNFMFEALDSFIEEFETEDYVADNIPPVYNF